MPLSSAGDPCTVPLPQAEILGCVARDTRQDHPSTVSDIPLTYFPSWAFKQVKVKSN